MSQENVEIVRGGSKPSEKRWSVATSILYSTQTFSLTMLSGFRLAAFLDPTATAGATESANTCGPGRKTSTICRSISSG
jgi:hypothetical protein